MGIARTFQNIRLFRQMSVLDNVKVGLHNQIRYSTVAGIFKLPSYFKKEKLMNEKAMSLLKVFDLQDEAEVLAQGKTSAVLQNPEVITAYLGE